MIRRGIADVFGLIDLLLAAGKRDEAMRYMSEALTHNAWALAIGLTADHFGQWLLGELPRARGGHSETQNGVLLGKILTKRHFL